MAFERAAAFFFLLIATAILPKTCASVVCARSSFPDIVIVSKTSLDLALCEKFLVLVL
jgi:hypothetical protein